MGRGRAEQQRAWRGARGSQEEIPPGLVELVPGAVGLRSRKMIVKPGGRWWGTGNGRHVW